MADALRSMPDVCEVEYLRGDKAPPGTAPTVLFEVAHGATAARHFDALRAQLHGAYAADLREFFFVNTDVGAPELAFAAARRFVANKPRDVAVVVRCLLPRTFIDCNRSIEPGAAPKGSAAGELTPGLPPWVADARDRELLLARYLAYRSVVTAAFGAVCGAGGFGVCVHTYAPRSIEVAVDEHVVASLRAAYAADCIGRWQLRPCVDLITHDPDGRLMAARALAEFAEAEFGAAGFEVVRNGTYSLHPSTLAYEFAQRFVGHTLCLEVRRDLLLDEFVPFRELVPNAERVARAAAPLATALLRVLT